MHADDTAPRTWAVVSAEGLTLLVRLTEADAVRLAASGTYPPGGEHPGISFAVPQRVATRLHEDWQQLRRRSIERLAADRIRNVRETLDAYDETRRLYPTPQAAERMERERRTRDQLAARRAARARLGGDAA